MAESKTKLSSETPAYKDIPLSFNAHPITGNVKILKGVDAVKQSVKNIVLTNFYERPYQPELGGDIISQLFENFDTLTAYNLSRNVRQALENYEPRVEVLDVFVEPRHDENNLLITIMFKLFNSIQPINVDILIERIR